MNAMTNIVAFGMPGWTELLVLAFVGLLIFGKRLPEVARSIGKSVVEFKKGMRDIKGDVENASSIPDARRSLESSPNPSLPMPAPGSPDIVNAEPKKEALESGD